MSYTLFVFCMGSFITAMVAAAFVISFVEFHRMSVEIERGYGPHIRPTDSDGKPKNRWKEASAAR